MTERRTPLYDWHVAHRARIVPFGGWSMPVQFSGIIDEHQSVRSSAGWFDISHMGRLVFEGSGAEDFLQYVWTNNVATMKPGQVRYGLICQDDGGILDDVLVYRLDGRWLMVVNASNREKILNWLRDHQQDYDVTITDRTEKWAMVAVQGPDAIRLTEPLVGSINHLRYYFAEESPSGGKWKPILLSRTGYTGEDGCEVILPAEEVTAFVEELTQSVKPCGLGARDTLRLEAAMPLYGHELSEEITPYQAGLAWAVKPDKGEFIGKAAMLEKKERSDVPMRVGLELEGRRAAREGCTVLSGDEEIGWVTSGSFAPTLQKSIAMAYVRPTSAEIGTACEVDIRGNRVAARVVKLPFYQRGS